MHQAAVIADEQARPAKHGGQRQEIERADQIQRPRRLQTGQQGRRQIALTRAAGDHHAGAIKGACRAGQRRRQIGETVGRPDFAAPIGGRPES